MDSPFSQINSYINKLPRSTGRFDAILIIRLIVSAALLSVALLVDMLPVFRIILTLLAAVVAGYDIVLDMIDAVASNDFLAPPIILITVTVLAFFIGYEWEGVLLLILFQLGSALVGYAVERTHRSAQQILSRTDRDLADRASVIIETEKTAEGELEKAIRKAASTVLKCLILIAVLFAVLVPVFTDLSVREAIHRALIILALTLPVSATAALPLPGIVGLSYATRFGVLFNHTSVLEKLQQIRTAVLDKSGIFSDIQPEFVGVKPELLDEDTFMEFVRHAVYYSDQPFAKAILANDDREFRLDLIKDFHDIPGSGVEVSIGNAEVLLAKHELLAERGVQVPFDFSAENSVYYMVIAGKYVGKVLMSDNLNQQNARLIPNLKSAGIRKCVLLTEDSRDESETLGTTLQADEVFSEFTDETKLRYLESLSKKETMYIYANSPEAHSNAAVDIRASKRGKYADALVSPEELEKLPAVIGLSYRVSDIVKENAVFVFIIKAILIFLGITGLCTVWFAVFVDFAAALASVLNAIRVTKKPIGKHL